MDYLDRGDETLGAQLVRREVFMHPYVLGEIALGSLSHRDRVLGGLARLLTCKVASPAEVLEFIGLHALGGSGIGYVDAHLLAATRLTPGCRIWTSDKRLATVARRLGLGETLH